VSVQLAIQPLSPRPGDKIQSSNGTINVRVQVTLSCGLPTCAGGRWDPRRFRVKASLYYFGKKDSDAGLSYSGDANEFSGFVNVRASGPCSLLVEAIDPETGAAGRTRVDFQVLTD